jgi:hypothetical protein
MKLRYFFFVMFAISLATHLPAQTTKPSNLTSTAQSALIVGGYLKKKNYTKAATEIMKNKAIATQLHMNSHVMTLLQDPKLKPQTLAAELKKNPITTIGHIENYLSGMNIQWPWAKKPKKKPAPKKN